MDRTGTIPSVASRSESPSTGIRRTVVVPMYREQARISATIKVLAGSALDVKDTQLLFVDDGSDDETVAVTAAEADRVGLAVDVIRVAHQGKGAAVAAGMSAAKGSAVAYTDADLSTRVSDIVACLVAIERGNADVVVGTRAHELSNVTRRGSHARKLSGWAYNTVLRGLGLTTLRDTQCGLKGFTCEAARRLFHDLQTPGFAFDIEVLARAERLGLRVGELPVTWTHVRASRVRIAHDAPRMLLDALRIRRTLRQWPQEPAVMVSPGVHGEDASSARVREVAEK